MTKKILLVLVVLSTGAARAQWNIPKDAPDGPIDQMQRTYTPAQIAGLMSYYKRPFNVIRYNLFMDWRAPLAHMNWTYPGTNIITLTADSAGLSSILLDAAGMRIDSIRVNGMSITAVQPDSATETILIQLGKSYAVGDTITLMIGYRHIADTNKGFYLYDKGTISKAYGMTDTTPERIAYTMSEPLDAHWWMPCMDQPYDKAKSEIRVAVPDSFTVSSNGILQSIMPSTDGKGGNVFDWKEDTVITTYLMCASASVFSHWTAYYQRQSNPADTVPIQYYIWPVDSPIVSGAKYNSVNAFRNVPQIMKNFSSPQYYGEFPFPKYGMTAVQPFAYGGMEHQTQTTIHRDWLDGLEEDPIAHEMSHQWFGDHVTCATWKDIWLNEGFATFSEALYHQLMFDTGSYDAYIVYAMNVYLHSNNDSIAIYDPAGQGVDIFNDGTVYLKGCVVLHMLRRILGDSVFFGSLRYHLRQFADSSATTDDLINDIDNFTRQDFYWFFTEWIYGAGQPLYNTTEWYTQDQNGTYTVHVRIDQPDTTRQLFKMPITLQYTAGSTITDNLVLDSARSQEFDFNVSAPPHNFTFDPYNSILKDTLSTTTGVDEQLRMKQGDMTTLNVAPNPARDNVLFIYQIAPASQARLQITNILGREVATLPLNGISSGCIAWKTQNLPAGFYFARLSGAGITASAMFQVVK